MRAVEDSCDVLDKCWGYQRILHNNAPFDKNTLIDRRTFDKNDTEYKNRRTVR
jgi:hypothetical protein